MPWTLTDPMLERAKLIALHHEGHFSIAELADRAGISRKTAYKWIARYQHGGADALADRSRARHGQRHRTPPGIEALLVACRTAHPHWGPKKILLYLAPRHPHLQLPAPSTAGSILDRHGLVQHRPRRRKTPHPGTHALIADAPHDVWTADFKGEFRTGDGLYCYPLTVCDAHSRTILCCDAFASTAHAGPLAAFRRLFDEHGLPAAIRSDNGTPFASTAIAGLSRLNVLWTRLGIEHHRIPPRPAGGERAPRAHAPHAEGGDDPPAGRQPGRAAGALRHVASGVQRRAAARGARRRGAVVALRGVGPPHALRAAAARVRGLR